MFYTSLVNRIYILLFGNTQYILEERNTVEYINLWHLQKMKLKHNVLIEKVFFKMNFYLSQISIELDFNLLHPNWVNLNCLVFLKLLIHFLLRYSKCWYIIPMLSYDIKLRCSYNVVEMLDIGNYVLLNSPTCCDLNIIFLRNTSVSCIFVHKLYSVYVAYVILSNIVTMYIIMEFTTLVQWCYNVALHHNPITTVIPH